MTMADLITLAPWGVTLFIFTGMLALCWKAMSALNTQAQSLAQIIAEIHPAAIAAATVAKQPAPPVAPPAPTPAPAPAPTPVVDTGLVNFIKKEEGFQPKATWDYKQWTNGYGTKAASSTEVVDAATAEARLTAEIAAAEKLVEQFVPAGAPKGLKQALTDLTYNAGSGWEEGSLGAAVKALKMDTIKADILQYNHAGGQVLPGLTARREAEVRMIDNPL